MIQEKNKNLIKDFTKIKKKVREVRKKYLKVYVPLSKKLLFIKINMKLIYN